MFSGPEGVIVLILVLVLFGGSQLPKLARNLGRAQKEFKDGLDEASRKDDKKDERDKDDRVETADKDSGDSASSN